MGEKWRISKINNLANAPPQHAGFDRMIGEFITDKTDFFLEIRASLFQLNLFC
jgi:hypothetical protein